MTKPVKTEMLKTGNMDAKPATHPWQNFITHGHYANYYHSIFESLQNVDLSFEQ